MPGGGGVRQEGGEQGGQVVYQVVVQGVQDCAVDVYLRF